MISAVVCSCVVTSTDSGSLAYAGEAGCVSHGAPTPIGSVGQVPVIPLGAVAISVGNPNNVTLVSPSGR